MAKRNNKGIRLDPAMLAQQKASLVRKNRQVIYLNDSEEDALNAYCKQFKVRSKASVLREIIMEKVLSELEGNHPTLF